METHGFVKVFDSLDEAFKFLHEKYIEYLADGWTIRDGTGVERVGTQWRVGILVAKDMP